MAAERRGPGVPARNVSGVEYFGKLADEGALDLDLLRIHVGMVIHTRSADRMFEDEYRKYGISNREFEVLICNYAFGDKYTTPGALAELLGMSPAGITAMLDRLAAKGLITRTVDELDARSRRIAATEEGLRLADLGLRIQLDWYEDRIGEALTKDEARDFLGMLSKLLKRSAPGYEPPPLS